MAIVARSRPAGRPVSGDNSLLKQLTYSHLQTQMPQTRIDKRPREFVCQSGCCSLSMAERTHEIRSFILQTISEDGADLTRKVASEFGITRQAVQYHLSR